MGAALTLEEVRRAAARAMVRAGVAMPPTSARRRAQIEADELTRVAKENWSSEARSAAAPPPFRPDLVDKVNAAELGGGPAPQKLKRVMLLEISQYLENYLLPHFDAEASTDAHIMSILVRPCGPPRWWASRPGRVGRAPC